VADSIHAINLEVRKGISEKAAQNKANQMGDILLNEVKTELSKSISSRDYERIKFAKWNELIDTGFTMKLDFLRNFYIHNASFKSKIHSIVRNVTSKEDRVFDDSEVHRLGDYIIEEMPELISRVNMIGIICDAYVYPFDGELAEFIEHIQKGQEFPEIKECVMDTEPKVLLIVK
jgi:hypothetical protein